jgi:hypothetical protein
MCKTIFNEGKGYIDNHFYEIKNVDMIVSIFEINLHGLFSKIWCRSNLKLMFFQYVGACLMLMNHIGIDMRLWFLHGLKVYIFIAHYKIKQNLKMLKITCDIF